MSGYRKYPEQMTSTKTTGVPNRQPMLPPFHQSSKLSNQGYEEYMANSDLPEEPDTLPPPRKPQPPSQGTKPKINSILTNEPNIELEHKEEYYYNLEKRTDIKGSVKDYIKAVGGVPILPGISGQSMKRDRPQKNMRNRNDYSEPDEPNHSAPSL